MPPKTSAQGRGDKPNNGQRGQIIAKLAQMGFVGQELAEFIKSGVTYEEIAHSLIDLIEAKNN